MYCFSNLPASALVIGLFEIRGPLEFVNKRFLEVRFLSGSAHILMCKGFSLSLSLVSIKTLQMNCIVPIPIQFTYTQVIIVWRPPDNSIFPYHDYVIFLLSSSLSTFPYVILCFYPSTFFSFYFPYVTLCFYTSIISSFYFHFEIL